MHQMVQTGRPMLAADVQNDPAWIGEPPLPFRSWLGAPIPVQGKVVAFINLDKTEPGFYRQRHVEQLTNFTGQAALAFENAWLASEAAHRIERERQIGIVNRAISASPDLPQLLDKAASLSAQLVEAQASAVSLLSETDTFTEPLAYQAPAALLQHLNPIDFGLAFSLLSRSGSLLLPDLANSPAPELPLGSHPNALTRWSDLLAGWQAAGVHSAMLTALQGGEQRLGLLIVFEMGDQRSFDERDLLALEAVGRQVGTTVQNVHLYEQQRGLPLVLALAF
jgi:GAF domain-containing protein